ncbi:MAG: outer membrane lipid asymmetry maintenance protein MlaD [Legionella sp.]
MNKQQRIDISVGIFMLLGILAIFLMVIKVSGFSGLVSTHGYQVFAEFADIGGLKVHAPVTVAGVKIGEVTKIDLQSGALNARVTMLLKDEQPIPYAETSARILTQGLLGSNYISIVPGFDDQDNASHPYLHEGDMIAKTQDAVILENLIGQLLFNIKK